MCPTRARNCSCIAAIASSRRPVSSWMRTSTREVRSPRAMRSATTTARPMGWVMVAVVRQAMNRPRAMAMATSVPPVRRERVWVCCASAAALALRTLCSSTSCASLSRHAASGGATRVIRPRVALTVSPSVTSLSAPSISGRVLRDCAWMSAISWRSSGDAPPDSSSAASSASCRAYCCRASDALRAWTSALRLSMSPSIAAERAWMPVALTVCSMSLASRALAAPGPVICCICRFMPDMEKWPRAATATSKASMHPKPRNSRREIERERRNVTACIVCFW